MLGHGVLAEKEPSTDLDIRHAVASNQRDLPLLRGQIGASLEGASETCSAVASSSRRVRSANASIPIDVNCS